MKVPFSDVRFSDEEREAVDAVLRDGWASKGKVCEEFQAQLEKYLGSHICMVNNGSSALMVALLANGMKARNTVGVPDFTFVATASVPAILGGRIIPVDCNPETFNHLHVPASPTLNGGMHFGISTDVAGLPIEGFDDFDFPDNLWIEDAAEALGAEVGDRKVGNSPHLTTFSFQATKQLSTIEGGAIASKDEELIARCRRIADYGRTETRYFHSELGMNFRMTDLQAALGLVRLRNLDNVLERRNAIARRYSEGLGSLLRPQSQPSYVTRHAWWTWIGLAQSWEERQRILEKLNDAEVDARIPWTPIHLQPCFPYLHETGYNNATEIWRRGLLVPIFNSMTDEQVEHVISTVNS